MYIFTHQFRPVILFDIWISNFCTSTCALSLAYTGGSIIFISSLGLHLHHNVMKGPKTDKDC